MQKAFKGLCLVICALAVQVGRTADNPPTAVKPPIGVPPPGAAPGSLPIGVVIGQVPGCEPAGIQGRNAKPPADLSGRLPVADYLDALFDCSDTWYLNQSGLLKPHNDWLEADTKQYTELLARGKFSWLVVPVQTQYFGFDRIERALLSAEIADAFATQGSAPDTLLVARALGEVRRRYESGAAMYLADTLGVSRMLEVFAGHDGQHQMTLTLQLKECRSPGACSLLKQHDWRNIPFGDEKPPFLAVRALRASLVHELLGQRVAVAVPKAGLRSDHGAVPDLSALGSVPTTAEPAAVAAVIAALAPSSDELGRDRLNVLALREALAGPSSAANQVRAAYAAFRLHRRPYALALLHGHREPAATTMRELLNGNLIEAQASLPSVEASDLKLILALAVQDLRSTYDRPGEFDDSAARRLFGSTPRAWAGAVYRRVNDLDSWNRQGAEVPKLLLDSAFPVAGQELASVIRGLRAVGRDAELHDALAVATLRHLRQAQRKLSPTDCCAAARANSGWPIYWLAESILESDVLKTIQFQSVTQGAPESAMETLKKYDEFYQGQPDFEVQRHWTESELAKLASNENSARISQQADLAEASAAYWSQGQNTAAETTVMRSSQTQPLRQAYSMDFPVRATWFPPMMGAGPTWACDQMAYATSEISPAFLCLNHLPPAQAAAVRADIGGRFHGNADAAAMLRSTLPRPADADPVADLRAAIAEEPEAWDNYRALGLMLLERDANYVEAQKVYLAYPDFKRKNPSSTVGVSNGAYEMGSELFWRGQYDLARPLYRLAADLGTGSEGSMTSEIRLALIDGDYESAAQGSLERGLRYPNPYAYRDYLSLLHVMGRGEEARAGFTQIEESFDDPSAWAAALVGQRMKSMTAEQFRSWVLMDEVRGSRHRGRHYAPIYTLWWMTTDRKPTTDLLQIMQSIERDEKREVEYNGIEMTRPSPTEENMNEMVKPSSFRRLKSPKMPLRTNGPSEYVLLADALAAHHAGKYEEAVAKFTALADRYPIESGDTMVALSYFAFAAAKTGDKLGLEKFIDQIPGGDKLYDVWLARAFFAAVRHESDKARQALLRAFNVRPHTESRPVMSEYQFVEACEIVLKETGDRRVASMILDWAKRWQRIHPMSSWAYAVEAGYATNPSDVNRALALTLYLDPASPRIAKFDAGKIAAARAWLKVNNPFLKAKAQPDSRPINSSGT